VPAHLLRAASRAFSVATLGRVHGRFGAPAPDPTRHGSGDRVSSTPPLRVRYRPRSANRAHRCSAARQAMERSLIARPVMFTSSRSRAAFTVAEHRCGERIGHRMRTDTPGRLMAFGRPASALGVQERDESAAPPPLMAVLERFQPVFSSVAAPGPGRVNQNEWW